jgi:hypothetical protein
MGTTMPQKALDKNGSFWVELDRRAKEIERLRAVIVDMLAGLDYLRTTNSVPYGFGIDRLEKTGKAALEQSADNSSGS